MVKAKSVQVNGKERSQIGDEREEKKRPQVETRGELNVKFMRCKYIKKPPTKKKGGVVLKLIKTKPNKV